MKIGKNRDPDLQWMLSDCPLGRFNYWRSGFFKYTTGTFFECWFRFLLSHWRYNISWHSSFSGVICIFRWTAGTVRLVAVVEDNDMRSSWPRRFRFWWYWQSIERRVSRYVIPPRRKQKFVTGEEMSQERNKAHGLTGTRTQDLSQTVRTLWPLSYRATRSTCGNFPLLN